jgi:hypothetical protein
MARKLFPEDGPDFQRALAERRKQLETERLVQKVGWERRERERRIERSREAKRKAKDTIARTQKIADDVARRVMAEARRILATKYPWED